MVSDIVFLIRLAKHKDMPEKFTDMILKRIDELEKNYSTVPQAVVSRGTPQRVAGLPPAVAVQSPSMQRLMEQNPDLIPKPPVPVTGAAAMALNDRQKMLNKKMNEKVVI
jgi:hypothetical protein